MDEAVKLAKANGYKPLKLYGTETELYSEMVLDPLFWQALGKALGWGDYADWDLEYDDPKLNSWRWHAGQYFMLLMDGGDTEKFWKELLVRS